MTINDVIFKHKKIEVNVPAYEVKVNGRPVHLRLKEFKLLCLLLSRKGTVVHSDQIMNEVWNEFSEPTKEAIQCHISRIRKKLGPKTASHIISIHGLGYKIKA